MNNTPEWILFDFGGCLDSDGVHSRELFYTEFRKFYPSMRLSLFQDAYTYSDQKVINESLVRNSNLLEMNQIMCTHIREKLKINDNELLLKVAFNITTEQIFYLKRNRSLIKSLSEHYQLGIVSNFSGNLKIILDDFSLLPHFKFVLDSYHIGFCKPDLAIFKMAIQQCQTFPEKIYFIGDNPLRDIAPAKSLGMKTILLSSQNNPTSDATHSISSLIELSSLLF